MINKRIPTIFVVTILLGSLYGCGAKYVHKSFKSQEIDRIVILPFIDNRKDPDPDLSFEQLASFGRAFMIPHLKYDKKYRIALSADIGNVSTYSVQNLPSYALNSENKSSINPDSVDRGWIKHLGPSTEKWILVPVIENVSSYSAFLSVGGSARVSAYLFNKHTGELWWHCSNQSSIKIGILVYGIMKTNSEENLIEGTVLSGASPALYP